MYDLIIRDATIVTSQGRQVADVAIKNGKFAYVGPRPPRSAKREISAIGKFLMPGVIDTAVQFSPNGDPSVWERESRAAVTGGVTTVLGLPSGDHPVTDADSARERANAASSRSWCNFGLWGKATADNSEALAKAIEQRLIVGTLACLGSGSDCIAPDLLESFVPIGGVLGVQVRTADPLELRPNADGTPEGSPEALAVMRAVREHERPVHWVHLSTAAELDLLDPVRGDLPVTTGVTPHHLFLSAEEDDVRTVPPVRPEQDRRTLWTAVRRGRLDCVASDHHSAAADSEGVPGSELLFPLMLSAVKYGRLSLEMLVSLTSEAPARIFGLENKGRIAKGADADLILFAEGEITRVGGDTLLSGAGWSPYLDREAAPKPDLVMVNGEMVAVRGELVGKAPGGKLVGQD
ncbi:MAG: dihydroorotase family protein [Alphaproteobacteria bacterium]|nr:dihydroorotase family protein [Alphaproteobacteria bacterium]